MSITKETLERSFNGKSELELDDLIHLIEDHFGYRVQLSRIDNESIPPIEQRKKMTSIIFQDPDVIYQLSQSEQDKQNGELTFSDSDEEFEQLLAEVQNEK